MIGLFGEDVVKAYMGHVQDNAEESVAACWTACWTVISSMKWIRAARSRCVSPSTGKRARRPSISLALPSSAPTISTRRNPSPVPPCSMSSGCWSKAISR
ncbi:hypothetical protein VXQ18_06115 [Brucella abortus]|nr:hypothetical protein [Brucella abortus]